MVTRSGPAEYGSDPIQLKNDTGVSVLLHVYPVTRDIDEAQIGSRGYVYVETRDDVFQFEVLFKVFNVGALTWVPSDVVMALPAGFKAFKAVDAMSGDARFELAPDRGARLLGTISPGEHDVSFRFQLARDEQDGASFRVGVPPHVAELRVIALAAPSMQLDVDGFERPRVDATQDGQRVLVTRRLLQRGEPELTNAAITLSGIPTPGPGRWIAIAIAAATPNPACTSATPSAPNSSCTMSYSSSPERVARAESGKARMSARAVCSSTRSRASPARRPNSEKKRVPRSAVESPRTALESMNPGQPARNPQAEDNLGRSQGTLLGSLGVNPRGCRRPTGHQSEAQALAHSESAILFNQSH